MRTLLLKTAAVAASFTLLLGAAPPLAAQATSATEAGAFEVASVKPNTSGDPPLIRSEPGGRFTTTNVPVRVLIRTAYQLQDFQIVGGPSWIASDRFDIIAKAEGNPSPLGVGGAAGPTNVMLQALLKERFKLTVHHETRELPIYALVVVRRDGRLGSRLRPTTVDCAAILAAKFSLPGRANAAPSVPPAPSQPGQAPLCGAAFGPGRLIAQGMTIARLGVNLSGRVNRVVVDRTGLAGNFDLDLEWMPDQFQGPGPLGPLPGAQPPTSTETSGPSIYTAVQEQLGLKLESTTGPVDVLVIDHLEPPTPD
jgi:uncharacterized protein (TIGR03435 family)